MSTLGDYLTTVKVARILDMLQNPLRARASERQYSVHRNPAYISVGSSETS